MFSVLNFVFLTTSLLSVSLEFFRSTGTAFCWPTPKSSIFVFKLFELVGTEINLLMPCLSTSAFKATKSFLAAKLDLLTPVAFCTFLILLSFYLWYDCLAPDNNSFIIYLAIILFYENILLLFFVQIFDFISPRIGF